MLKIQSSYQKCLSVDQMGIFTQQIRIKMEKEVFFNGDDRKQSKAIYQEGNEIINRYF